MFLFQTEVPEKDGSTSESSLESSSGYGSQTIPGVPDENVTHNEGLLNTSSLCA